MEKKVTGIQKLIAFFGRIAFSAIFLLSGVNKILNWDATEQHLVNQMLDVLSKSYHQPWAQSLLDTLLPLAPTLLLIATIVELGGGLLIFLGLQVRLGAFMLVLFLIPTTFFFHNFWSLEGSDAEHQLIHFMKNLSIFGGGLTLLAFGKGNRRVSS